MNLKSMYVYILALLPVYGLNAETTTTTTTKIGELYTDLVGRTLYTFSSDTLDSSSCNDRCAILWPPFLVDSKTATHFDSIPDFSILVRDNGSKQWALEGKALYRWFNDTEAGDIHGAGMKGIWHVARADDVSIRMYNDGNRVYLVDADNFSLYTYDKDTANKTTCYEVCEMKWPPAYVSPDILDKPIRITGGFGMVKRRDNSYQWTFKGKPLYRWAGDTKPGQTMGDGIGGVWRIATI